MDPRHAPAGARRLGIPRTRGDGPARVGPLYVRVVDSPHPRGWTRTNHACRRQASGFPAPAGMDPFPSSGEAGPARIPRTRGDGPAPASASRAGTADSPHPRGWTQTDLPRVAAGAGFPAPAGMDPGRSASSARSARIPRTRGDGPPTFRPCAQSSEDSPHPRGWTLVGVIVGVGQAGFPAPAGMDPSWATTTTSSPGIPRTRGDGPLGGVGLVGLLRDSPHPRGWTVRTLIPPGIRSGFPAPAGMDRPRSTRWPGAAWIPRTRGDGPGSVRVVREIGPDSPHPRGWTCDEFGPDGPLQGFPAPAGMDPMHT